MKICLQCGKAEENEIANYSYIFCEKCESMIKDAVERVDEWTE